MLLRNYTHLTALGSSFASGPGILPLKPTSQPVNQSTLNYPTLLAARLGAGLKLTDLTSGGATLLNMYADGEGQILMDGSVWPVQAQGVSGDTDLITITGGGNDIGFIGGLMEDTMTGGVDTDANEEVVDGNAGAEESVRTAQGGEGEREARGRTGPEAPKTVITSSTTGQIQISTTPLAVDETELYDRFQSLISILRTKAPKADIILVEYLSVLPPLPLDPSHPLYNAFPPGRYEYHLGKQSLLQRVTARVGRDMGVRVVPVSSLSQDHAVGSAEPWCKGYSAGMLERGEAPWHPNEAGHAAVAKMVFDALQSE